jgi:hypothetical protein
MNAKITGIDIKDSCNPDAKTNNRINPLVGDSLSDDFITNNINSQFDIIFEDASHIKEDQVNTFLKYNKFVKPGGIYIIEDIPAQNLDFVYNSLNIPEINKNFSIDIVDLTSKKDRYDDILIIFKKY